MKSAERVFVYGSLAACLFLGLAHEGRSSVAAAAASGRVGLTDQARVGTIDVLAVVEKLIASEAYRGGRQKNEATAIEALKPLNDELDRMRKEASGLPDGSESLKALNARFMEKSRAFQEVTAKANEGVEMFNTAQVSEAYNLVSNAAVAMADARGYTHLFASKVGTFTLTSKNIPGAVQEMLARPLLKGVAADDLTEALVKEMKLELVQVPTVATPTTPGTAPTPVAPK